MSKYKLNSLYLTYLLTATLTVLSEYFPHSLSLSLCHHYYSTGYGPCLGTWCQALLACTLHACSGALDSSGFLSLQKGKNIGLCAHCTCSTVTMYCWCSYLSPANLYLMGMIGICPLISPTSFCAWGLIQLSRVTRKKTSGKLDQPPVTVYLGNINKNL